MYGLPKNVHVVPVHLGILELDHRCLLSSCFFGCDFTYCVVG